MNTYLGETVGFQSTRSEALSFLCNAPRLYMLFGQRMHISHILDMHPPPIVNS